MLKKMLIGGVAATSIAIAGAAFAQTPSGSGSSPAPSANPNATGQAPGLQNNRNDVPRGAAGNERAQERTGASGSSTTTQSKPGASGVATGQADTRGGSRDNLTTGQVPKVQISDQQRTQLRTRFQQAKIRTVSRDQINVAISVGTVLPSTVTFAPVPAPIVAIVPAFRGYQAVRVGAQILIVEPGSRRIVYIFEA